MEYGKRKKKQKSKLVSMKIVRINDRTTIEVNINIPDEVAKEEYLKKLELSNSKMDGKFNR